MNLWQAVAGEGTQLKRDQLEREIGRLKDPTERANLDHTFSKLFMFLEDDLARGRPRRKGEGEMTASWRERCQRFDDGHIVTDNDIQMAMKEEIGELRARIERLEAALEPFARNVEAISLFATLGHITREDLWRARAALAGKEGT